MSGVHILGQNQTTTNIAVKIANLTYKDDEGENQVCKAVFGGFLCLCVLTFVLIILISVRNTWRKGKQQVQCPLNSINSGGPVTV